MRGRDETRELIAFGEELLGLLDRGSFVATYKYAVLIALMDLCIEGTDRHGFAPTAVTTRQLAEKVTELYWPHTKAFRGRTLRQNTGHQARILSDVGRFRSSLPDPSITLDRARRESPRRFERLIRAVEWTLILMPLPRLQVVGGRTERLIYEIGWGTDVDRERSVVGAYQETGSGFDNQIRFLPSVGDHLVRLNGLLRPLIHRAWAAMVAQLNGLDESCLERFLFGEDRTSLAALRPVLSDLQDRTCFYCERKLTERSEVDHFIPWARHPDNGIENLVVADQECNASKRDFLAAGEHVRKWRSRNSTHADALARSAASHAWERHPAETLGVARGLYLRVAPGTPLWIGRDTFGPADPPELHAALE
jgi:hypothetical protein